MAILSELIQDYKIKMDKLDTQSYPEIQDEIIVFLLNEAIIRFIKQRYGGTNVKRDSFEESQKRTDDLRTVVVYDTIASSGAGFFPNSFTYPLPADYWFSLLEQTDATCDCVGTPKTERVKVKAIQHNNLNTVMQDPFNRPENTEVVRVMAQNDIQLITDGVCTTGNFYLGYIANNFKLDPLTPAQVISMPEHTHSEIVDIAVTVTLDGIESGRFNLNRVILSEQE